MRVGAKFGHQCDISSLYFLCKELSDNIITQVPCGKLAMEMDRTSQLCKKISDLTALLALMFDRAPVLEKRDEVHTTTSDDIDPTSSISAEYNIAIDDEETENINETDFEKHPATEEAALDDLKGRALDRLSEVLARFKSAKGPRTSKVGNLGAKHVASVVMVEDTEAKRVTLYFSKNEGLDTVDKKFLDKLKELLEDIAKDSTWVSFLKAFPMLDSCA